MHAARAGRGGCADFFGVVNPTRETAGAWQDTYRTGGQQPWHLDADQTALSFTTGFLGLTDIDRVITHEIGATDAHVTVGYATTDGQTSTAATIHLMRFGTGHDAPGRSSAPPTPT